MLMIRTSGEMRVPNLPAWDMPTRTIWVTDAASPDFRLASARSDPTNIRSGNAATAHNPAQTSARKLTVACLITKS